MRNSVSGVTGVPVSMFATPMPRAYTTRSPLTTAIAAPGVFVARSSSASEAESAAVSRDERSAPASWADAGAASSAIRVTLASATRAIDQRPRDTPPAAASLLAVADAAERRLELRQAEIEGIDISPERIADAKHDVLAGLRHLGEGLDVLERKIRRFPIAGERPVARHGLRLLLELMTHEQLTATIVGDVLVERENHVEAIAQTLPGQPLLFIRGGGKGERPVAVVNRIAGRDHPEGASRGYLRRGQRRSQHGEGDEQRQRETFDHFVPFQCR